MLTIARPPAAAAKAVRRHSPKGTQLLEGTVLTASCRKYTLPVRWKDRRVQFLRPRFVGWQHLGEGPDTVRVTTKQHGKTLSVACVSAGPFAAAAQAAIAVLATDRRLAHRRFTVASLSVSALMVQALWLRSSAGHRFWILEPSHVAAVRGRPLTPRQFESSLRRVFRVLLHSMVDIDERLSGSTMKM
jgi:hypothetical protein